MRHTDLTDRTAFGLVQACLEAEVPPGLVANVFLYYWPDIAAVITKISHRVMHKLRQLRYLEAGPDATVATDYDPLRADAPELARTMAASVQRRIAFGERTGQQVRRIDAGFGSEGEHPLLSGALCASVHGFSLHANTQVPAHRRD